MQTAQKLNSFQSNDLNSNLLSIVEQLSKTSASFGLDLVEVSGIIDSVVRVHASHTDDFASMANMAAQILNKNHEMNEFASDAAIAIERANSDTKHRIESAVATLDLVRTWSDSARRTGDKMALLSESLTEVAAVTKSIEAVASATTMIALNATIESARAGEAGKGFAVVAQEIKSLANQTKDASSRIQRTISRLETEVRDIEQTSKQTITIADEMNKELSNQTGSMNQILVAFEQVSGLIANVTECAHHIQNETDAMHQNVTRLEHEVSQLDIDLKNGATKLESISLVGEEIMQLTSSAGIKNKDSEMIELAIAKAKEISRIFEEAIASKKMSESDFFDENYVEVPGSNPKQYQTRFLQFTDNFLPPIQEPALNANSAIVFCAAIDRNGYLPTHNKKFSQIQTKDDIEWNTANCRNRRIFNDRVGLRAGKNTRPFLVQAYRRDMGNGQFAMMKDISAPIMIGSRHWGGFRIGVKAEK